MPTCVPRLQPASCPSVNILAAESISICLLGSDVRMELAAALLDSRDARARLQLRYTQVKTKNNYLAHKNSNDNSNDTPSTALCISMYQSSW